MDHYGIGAAIRAAVSMYCQSARGTGRTMSLVESVKDGDRLVFTNMKEAGRVERLCKERGVKIEAVVIDPKRPHAIFDRGTAKGRTIFDHQWVEEFYEYAIATAASIIDQMERETSGDGVKHRETARAAREMARFRFN